MQESLKGTGHANPLIVVRVAFAKTLSSALVMSQIFLLVDILPGMATVSSTMVGCILGIDVGVIDGSNVGLKDGNAVGDDVGKCETDGFSEG